MDLLTPTPDLWAALWPFIKAHIVRERLDGATRQNVHYAIPLWLRDEQIKLAIQRVKGRIEPRFDKPETTSDDPIAVAAFGPSLRETWEKIRDFKYVISCSGATRFLIERGIIPQWHVAVDPLPGHTVRLIGQPHPDVEYLISSTCHPDVFDHLEGFNVKLWHVFDSSEEALRTLPRGEWAVTGGCDVGMRSMSLARFLGFKHLHVFGMDGSYRDGRRHADAHPVPGFASEVEYPKGSGQIFYTTPGMLEAARSVPHELDQMPDVVAKFYGEGLVQAMARDYKRKPMKANAAGVIAFNKPALISAEYRELNRQLHVSNLAYGVGGGKYAEKVMSLVENVRPPIRSVLDYGCGKGYLGKELAARGLPIWEYDPAVPGKDELPRPADLVCCFDVLEHIEPDKILFVLDDLRRCVKSLGYFIIHTGPSSKTLSDGRNAHILQRDRAWWEKMLGKFFKVGQVQETPPILTVVVGKNVAAPKPKMAQVVEMASALVAT